LKKSSWQSILQEEFIELEKLHPNKIGLYIKDLNNGEEYALHADESWYLASTVKIPIAIEVLRQVDAKDLTLEDEIGITLDDYVDGNGPLKSMKPGSKVSIRFLMEQMIVWSDNMASDILIRVVGLDKVNALVKKLSPSGISPITTLKDVRRHLYSEIHPKGFELSGQNMLKLRKIRSPIKRFAEFASLLQLDKKELKLPNIHEAYEAYYQKSLNSGSPRSYSKILEAAWEGKLLSSSSRDFLMQTMMKTQTGRKRIKAGLAGPWVFAHKTGTQYRRVADVGYLWNPEDMERKPIIVLSYVRDDTESSSSKILEEVAKIISRSGVL
jgi:beta-lactamase class A